METSKDNRKTTISITNEVKEQLDSLGKKNETYDDLILRLVSEVKR